jgi:hypothetical protein
VLALWHFCMAAAPSSGRSGAVPVAEGQPLFVPSVRSTVAVGVVLVGLLARAVGEFKHVGFFKRVVGSRFATLDTYVYSPLCLALAMGVALVARGSAL